MFNRIWKKFTFALLVVAFTPVCYFGYEDLQNARRSVADEALHDIFLNCVTRAKDIKMAFINANADIAHIRSGVAVQFLLDAMSRSPEESVFWKEMVEKEFTRFLSLENGYSSVGLVDDYGDEVAVAHKSGDSVFTLPDIQLRNRLTAPYYVGAARLGKFGVAAMPMRSSADPELDLRGLTLIRYATKVFGEDGRPAGVAYIDLNGSEILDGLSSLSFERRRQAALVTNNGAYIFNPFVKPGVGVPPKQTPENISAQFPAVVVSQIISGGKGMVADDPDNLFAYSAVYPQPDDRKRFYVVYDRYPRSLLADKLYDIKKKYLVGAMGALALVIAVSIIVSRALTRPINRLRDGVERFGRHEMSHRLDIRSGDEMESLASAYNMMAESLQEYSQSLENKVEERSRRIKQVERELMRAEKLAAIGYLSAGVAHEINNPISIIITRLGLIDKSVKKGDMRKALDDLEVLKRHATRIGRIAGSLLAFSRSDPGKLTAVDLNEIVERVTGLLGYSPGKGNTEFRLSLDSALPLVWANAGGMEQVIYNIAHNACQASAPGQAVTIVTRTSGDGRIVELEISDSGVGMSKDVMKSIFEPFFTTRQTGEGTGLGLSISYGLVKDFGGFINVDSRPGEGTVFTVYLDAAQKHLAARKSRLTKADA